VRWHTREETKHLLSLMSSVNLAKVEAAKRAGRRMVGGLYRRTRRMTKGPRYNALKSVLTTLPAVCGRRPAAPAVRAL
jgi:DNA (cytosine-5)-methyltransferase 1